MRSTPKLSLLLLASASLQSSTLLMNAISEVDNEKVHSLVSFNKVKINETDSSCITPLAFALKKFYDPTLTDLHQMLDIIQFLKANGGVEYTSDLEKETCTNILAGTVGAEPTRKTNDETLTSTETETKNTETNHQKSVSRDYSVSTESKGSDTDKKKEIVSSAGEETEHQKIINLTKEAQISQLKRERDVTSELQVIKESISADIQRILDADKPIREDLKQLSARVQIQENDANNKHTKMLSSLKKTIAEEISRTADKTQPITVDDIRNLTNSINELKTSASKKEKKEAAELKGKIADEIRSTLDISSLVSKQEFLKLSDKINDLQYKGVVETDAKRKNDLKIVEKNVLLEVSSLIAYEKSKIGTVDVSAQNNRNSQMEKKLAILENDISSLKGQQLVSKEVSLEVAKKTSSKEDSDIGLLRASLSAEIDNAINKKISSSKLHDTETNREFELASLRASIVKEIQDSIYSQKNTDVKKPKLKNMSERELQESYDLIIMKKAIRAEVDKATESFKKIVETSIQQAKNDGVQSTPALQDMLKKLVDEKMSSQKHSMTSAKDQALQDEYNRKIIKEIVKLENLKATSMTPPAPVNPPTASITASEIAKMIATAIKKSNGTSQPTSSLSYSDREKQEEYDLMVTRQIIKEEIEKYNKQNKSNIPTDIKTTSSIQQKIVEPVSKLPSFEQEAYNLMMTKKLIQSELKRFSDALPTSTGTGLSLSDVHKIVAEAMSKNITDKKTERSSSDAKLQDEYNKSMTRKMIREEIGNFNTASSTKPNNTTPVVAKNDLTVRAIETMISDALSKERLTTTKNKDAQNDYTTIMVKKIVAAEIEKFSETLKPFGSKPTTPTIQSTPTKDTSPSVKGETSTKDKAMIEAYNLSMTKKLIASEIALFNKSSATKMPIEQNIITVDAIQLMISKALKSKEMAHSQPAKISSKDQEAYQNLMIRKTIKEEIEAFSKQMIKPSIKDANQPTLSSTEVAIMISEAIKKAQLTKEPVKIVETQSKKTTKAEQDAQEAYSLLMTKRLIKSEIEKFNASHPANSVAKATIDTTPITLEIIQDMINHTLSTTQLNKLRDVSAPATISKEQSNIDLKVTRDIINAEIKKLLPETKQEPKDSIITVSTIQKMIADAIAKQAPAKTNKAQEEYNLIMTKKLIASELALGLKTFKAEADVKRDFDTLQLKKTITSEIKKALDQNKSSVSTKANDTTDASHIALIKKIVDEEMIKNSATNQKNTNESISKSATLTQELILKSVSSSIDKFINETKIARETDNASNTARIHDAKILADVLNKSQLHSLRVSISEEIKKELLLSQTKLIELSSEAQKAQASIIDKKISDAVKEAIITGTALKASEINLIASDEKKLSDMRISILNEIKKDLPVNKSVSPKEMMEALKKIQDDSKTDFSLREANTDKKIADAIQKALITNKSASSEEISKISKEQTALIKMTEETNQKTFASMKAEVIAEIKKMIPTEKPVSVKELALALEKTIIDTNKSITAKDAIIDKKITEAVQKLANKNTSLMTTELASIIQQQKDLISASEEKEAKELAKLRAEILAEIKKIIPSNTSPDINESLAKKQAELIASSEAKDAKALSELRKEILAEIKKTLPTERVATLKDIEKINAQTKNDKIKHEALIAAQIDKAVQAQLLQATRDGHTLSKTDVANISINEKAKLVSDATAEKSKNDAIKKTVAEEIKKILSTEKKLSLKELDDITKKIRTEEATIRATERAELEKNIKRQEQQILSLKKELQNDLNLMVKEIEVANKKQSIKDAKEANEIARQKEKANSENLQHIISKAVSVILSTKNLSTEAQNNEASKAEAKRASERLIFEKKEAEIQAAKELADKQMKEEKEVVKEIKVAPVSASDAYTKLLSLFDIFNNSDYTTFGQFARIISASSSDTISIQASFNFDTRLFVDHKKYDKIIGGSMINLDVQTNDDAFLSNLSNLDNHDFQLELIDSIANLSTLDSSLDEKTTLEKNLIDEQKSGDSKALDTNNRIIELSHIIKKMEAKKYPLIEVFCKIFLK